MISSDPTKGTQLGGGSTLSLGSAPPDLRERIALAQLARKLVGEGVDEPVVADRYELRDELGAGGMGVVRLAWDRELRREVAVKFLRLGRRARRADEERLVREAQALARLSHPNVVAVYDVRATDEAFYVSMEYVRGQTLRQWLESGPHPWRDVVGVFVQAAAGLAAAHDAGLVHRDFKPTNVMLGDDGRIRVVDFGLARPTETRPAGTGPADTTYEDDGLVMAPFELPDLTTTGVVLGTPGYAPPEQIAGRELDPRADQFSFCVALWESLHGCRPFERAAIVRAAAGDPLPSPAAPGRSTTPAWLRALLLRGLEADPRRRFPSMRDLSAALLRGARARPWRSAIVVLVAVGLGLGGLGLAGRTSLGTCRTEVERLDAAWNPTVAAQLHRAFLDSGQPYAEAAAVEVTSRLDRSAAGWRDAYLSTCRAGAPSVEPDGLAFDRRMACLERQGLELAALVETLAQADVESVRTAVAAASALPEPGACFEAAGSRDAALVTASRDELRAIDVALARATAQLQAGRLDEAAATSARALAEVDALGTSEPRARAWLVRGQILLAQGNEEQAYVALSDAYFEAMRVGEPARAADAVIDLVRVSAEDLGRLDEARQWARHGHSLVESGQLDVDHRARLLQVEGVLAYHEQDYERSIALNREALAIYVGRPEPDPIDEVWARNNIGNALQELGRGADALAEHDRALELAIDMFGTTHPNVALLTSGRAGDLLRAGRVDDGLEEYRKALAIREQALDRTHMDVGASHSNIAVVLVELGRFDEAERHYRSALEIYEINEQGEGPLAGNVLYNLGYVHYQRERFDAAEHAFRRALAVREALYGPEHPAVTDTLNALAVALEEQGTFGPAQELHLRVLGTRTAREGGRSLSVGQTLYNLGLHHLKREDWDGARPWLEQALELADGLAAADFAAEARIELGRALARGERPTGRAEALVLDGRARWLALGNAQEVAYADRVLRGEVGSAVGVR